MLAAQTSDLEERTKDVRAENSLGFHGECKGENNSSPRPQTAIGPTRANRVNWNNLIRFDNFLVFLEELTWGPPNTAVG